MKAYDAMKRAGSTSWSSFTMVGSLTTRRSKPRTVGSSLLVFWEDRVNLMIKTAWAEFQKQGKVRIQFLCIVLDSSYTEPDEPLRK